MLKLKTMTVFAREWQHSLSEVSLRISFLGDSTECTIMLKTDEALAFWHELGALLDEIQPGATGLRPLPDGDPSEVDAMMLRDAADQIMRAAR